MKMGSGYLCVNSMSGLFHEEIPDEFLDRVFSVIEKTPHHTFQILTKRSEYMHSYFVTIQDLLPRSRLRAHPWNHA